MRECPWAERFSREVNGVRKRKVSLPYAGLNRFRFEGFSLSLSAPPANVYETLAVKRSQIKARSVKKKRLSGIVWPSSGAAREALKSRRKTSEIARASAKMLAPKCRPPKLREGMTKSPSDNPVSRISARAWAAAVFAAAVLVFAGTLFYPFRHDDLTVIGQNPIVQESGRSLEVFTNDYWAMRAGDSQRDRLYRPITILSFVINHVLGGNAPVGYRAVNILLHGLASVLLLWMGLRLGLRESEAGAVALLFAVHPVHTEAVNAVVARADLLVAVGVFTGLGLLAGRVLPKIRSGESSPEDGKKRGGKKRSKKAAETSRGSGGWSWALGALCALALLSKEIGIALILCAALWWVWGRIAGTGGFREDRQALGQAFLSLGIVLLAYLAMRYAALGTWMRPGIPSILDNPLAQEAFGWRQLGAIGVLGRYFRLLVWPWPLTIDYSFDQLALLGSGATIWIFAGAGLSLIWAGAAWRWRSSRPEVAFGLALFIAAFFPVSNFAVRIGTVMAERLMYLPSAGFLLALVPPAVRLLERRNTKALLGVVAVMAFLFGGMSWMRNKEWSSFSSLWESAARVSPRSARALRLYGQSLYRTGKFREAVPPLERAVRILPLYDEAWVDLGIAQMQSRQEEKAEVSLRKALELNPAIPEVHLSLGVLYVGTGRPEKARFHLDRAISLNPRLIEARFNLGTLQLKAGDHAAAARQFRAALAVDPRRGDIHHNLAIALFVGGNRNAARRHALEATRLGIRLPPEMAESLGLVPGR